MGEAWLVAEVVGWKKLVRVLRGRFDFDVNLEVFPEFLSEIGRSCVRLIMVGLSVLAAFSSGFFIWFWLLRVHAVIFFQAKNDRAFRRSRTAEI